MKNVSTIFCCFRVTMDVFVLQLLLFIVSDLITVTMKNSSNIRGKHPHPIFFLLLIATNYFSDLYFTIISYSLWRIVTIWLVKARTTHNTKIVQYIELSGIIPLRAIKLLYRCIQSRSLRKYTIGICSRSMLQLDYFYQHVIPLQPWIMRKCRINYQLISSAAYNTSIQFQMFSHFS